MPYELKLNQEAHLIEAICSGNLTFEEIEALDAKIVEMLDSIAYDYIHLLTDIGAVTSHPNNLVKVWTYTKPIAAHDKLGTWFVLGSNNPFTQFLVETISRLGKLRVKVVNNYDEVSNTLRQNA